MPQSDDNAEKHGAQFVISHFFCHLDKGESFWRSLLQVSTRGNILNKKSLRTPNAIGACTPSRPASFSVTEGSFSP